MNTRRNTTRRLEEEFTNVGDSPHNEQVPPHKVNSNVDQAPANPPPITEARIRAIIAQMSQAMTTQLLGMLILVFINKSLLWLPI